MTLSSHFGREPSDVSAFKTCEPDYIQIDVKYLPRLAGETSQRYLFAAMLHRPVGRDTALRQRSDMLDFRS